MSATLRLLGERREHLPTVGLAGGTDRHFGPSFSSSHLPDHRAIDSNRRRCRLPSMTAAPRRVHARRSAS
jgi:hypothetical protein